jgi:hypothetical protein
MTRTTLDIDPTVLQQLRERAAAERKSMGQVASEQLARSLEDEAPAEPPPFQWEGKAMGKPRIDLEDKEALWRILDAEWYDRAGRA